MAGLSALPGVAPAWTPHAGSPAPCILFEPVRAPAGDVLDFHCASLNAAAEDVVRDWGLEPRLSSWPAGGVSGLAVEDCVRLGATGVPLSVPLRVRREGVDARFQAVAVREGEGFALWLLPPVEEDAQALRETLEREREARRKAEAALEGARATQAEHEQAEATLREAEERYRLAARATHDVLWDWDLATGAVRWEASPGELFGYGPDTSTHGLDWWAVRVHPDEREAAAAGLRDFVASTRAAWQAEYRFLRGDGTWAHVLDRGVLARDGAGRPVRMIGSMMDMTERHRALERLSEEARFRERFIGILGHDLRNPLNAISLSARALRRRSAHNSNHQQLAQRIERSAARMGTMISDILDLTRARLSGGIPLNLAPVNLTTVCRQVVEELTAAWPERYIAFDVDGRADGVWDADRLAQVLSNLVGNALEHGAQDAPVILRCMEQDVWQVLEVNNPGAPIPAPQLATLFDPFRQASTAREKGRRRGGLGLGLFIVREIVQAHGGSVHVSSSEHDGTTFTVSLPRDARAARAAATVSAPRGA
ncbi:sensor histidine kinase [Pyxidicoccus trucidator]|uniref:sensor histidine kinase n=1 Tax=Pyxidicoccus trucidator TaxID=2709662 RepID=UPI001F079395|nr:ATP-binding protein [Pyxidicoccus trucidator]